MTYFECYADECLLKCLGFNSKELRGGHSFGRSKVCRKLSKTSNSWGLIDEDPNASRDSYLKHLFSLNPIYEDVQLLCSKDKKRNNKIIVLRPNLEAWTLKLAMEEGVDLAKEYGLPSDWKGLHEVLGLQKNFQKRESL